MKSCLALLAAAASASAFSGASYAAENKVPAPAKTFVQKLCPTASCSTGCKAFSVPFGMCMRAIGGTSVVIDSCTSAGLVTTHFEGARCDGPSRKETTAVNKCTQEGSGFIENVCEAFSGAPLAVEFKSAAAAPAPAKTFVQKLCPTASCSTGCKAYSVPFGMCMPAIGGTSVVIDSCTSAGLVTTHFEGARCDGPSRKETTAVNKCTQEGSGFTENVCEAFSGAPLAVEFKSAAAAPAPAKTFVQKLCPTASCSTGCKAFSVPFGMCMRAIGGTSVVIDSCTSAGLVTTHFEGARCDGPSRKETTAVNKCTQEGSGFTENVCEAFSGAPLAVEFKSAAAAPAPAKTFVQKLCPTASCSTGCKAFSVPFGMCMRAIGGTSVVIDSCTSAGLVTTHFEGARCDGPSRKETTAVNKCTQEGSGFIENVCEAFSGAPLAVEFKSAAAAPAPAKTFVQKLCPTASCSTGCKAYSVPFGMCMRAIGGTSVVIDSCTSAGLVTTHFEGARCDGPSRKETTAVNKCTQEGSGFTENVCEAFSGAPLAVEFKSAAAAPAPAKTFVQKLCPTASCSTGCKAYSVPFGMCMPAIGGTSVVIDSCTSAGLVTTHFEGARCDGPSRKETTAVNKCTQEGSGFTENVCEAFSGAPLAVEFKSAAAAPAPAKTFVQKLCPTASCSTGCKAFSVPFGMCMRAIGGTSVVIDSCTSAGLVTTHFEGARCDGPSRKETTAVNKCTQEGSGFTENVCEAFSGAPLAVEFKSAAAAPAPAKTFVQKLCPTASCSTGCKAFSVPFGMCMRAIGGTSVVIDSCTSAGLVTTHFEGARCDGPSRKETTAVNKCTQEGSGFIENVCEAFSGAPLAVEFKSAAAAPAPAKTFVQKLCPTASCSTGCKAFSVPFGMCMRAIGGTSVVIDSCTSAGLVTTHFEGARCDGPSRKETTAVNKCTQEGSGFIENVCEAFSGAPLAVEFKSAAAAPAPAKTFVQKLCPTASCSTGCKAYSVPFGMCMRAIGGTSVVIDSCTSAGLVTTHFEGARCDGPSRKETTAVNKCTQEGSGFTENVCEAFSGAPLAVEFKSAAAAPAPAKTFVQKLCPTASCSTGCKAYSVPFGMCMPAIGGTSVVIDSCTSAGLVTTHFEGARCDGPSRKETTAVNKCTQEGSGFTENVCEAFSGAPLAVEFKSAAAAPAPAKTFVQKLCPTASCSTGCKAFSVPFGMCMPAIGGTSVVIDSCTSAGLVTTHFEGARCDGPSRKETTAVNKCTQEGSGFTENVCEAFSGAPLAVEFKSAAAAPAPAKTFVQKLCPTASCSTGCKAFSVPFGMCMPAIGGTSVVIDSCTSAGLVTTHFEGARCDGPSRKETTAVNKCTQEGSGFTENVCEAFSGAPLAVEFKSAAAAPAPAKTFVQKLCPTASCSTGCKAFSVPFGMCMRAIGGTSVVIDSCTSAGLVTTHFEGARCDGPSRKETTAVNKCTQEGSGFTENVCEAFSGAPLAVEFKSAAAAPAPAKTFVQKLCPTASCSTGCKAFSVPFGMCMRAIGGTSVVIDSCTSAGLVTTHFEGARCDGPSRKETTAVNKCTQEGSGFIENVCEAFSGAPLAVEFKSAAAAPAPAKTFVQKLCPTASCSTGCKAFSVPFGMCMRAIGGTSVVIDSCTSAGLVTTHFEGARCDGPSRKETTAVNKCTQEGSGFTENVCEAFSGAPLAVEFKSAAAAPAPAKTFVQKLCPTASCSTGCKAFSVPFGMCMRAIGGTSVVIDSCTSAGLVTTHFEGARCDGPSRKETTAVNKCTQEGSGFIENVCEAFSGAPRAVEFKSAATASLASHFEAFVAGLVGLL